MSTPYVNRFGRRGGRGLRPLLLLPKVLLVGVYFGSLAAALAIWATSDFSPPLSPATRAAIAHVSLLVRFVAVPALLLVIVLGVALLLQHRREFLRMRWLRLKLLLLFTAIPAAHFFLSTRLWKVRDGDPLAAPSFARQFTLGMILTLVASAAIILLGRHKPRLGQSYAPVPPSAQPAPPHETKESAATSR